MLAAACCSLLAGWSVPPSEALADAQVNFQYRPRAEMKGAGYKNPNTEATHAYFEASHRARLGAKFTHASAPGAAALVEIQDVRFFGEEFDTLNDFVADGFDLHQGLVDLYDGESRLGVRVGRQELTYEEHRLFGNVDWTQQGRSHDAVVFRWDPKPYEMHLGLAKNLGRSRLTGTYNKAYKDYSTYRELSFLWVKRSFDQAAASVYAVYDTPKDVSTRWTVGPRVESKHFGLQSRAEAYYQQTKKPDKDAVKGYFLGLTTGKTVPIGGLNATVAGWYDLSSPDFYSLYPTAHKFFGYMDLFLAFPADTKFPGDNGTKGLHDPALRLTVAAGKWKVLLDAHYFLLTKDADGEKAIGPEVDLTIPVAVHDAVTLTCGASALVPGKAMENLKGKGEGAAFAPADLQTGIWSYVMLDAKF